MERADWDGIFQAVLFKKFGSPVKETDKHWFWPGTRTERPDESKSFQYEPATGRWRDWSASEGGRGVYSFLRFLDGMDDVDITAYLRGESLLLGGKSTPQDRARIRRMAKQKTISPMALLARRIEKN